MEHFEVIVELPEQIVSVWARDKNDAEWRAWQMIGEAGVKAYGTLNAALAPPPASPAVTHTGPK